MVLLFFKQKTAYEMRISDWSSDVCSSDLKMVGVGMGLQQPVDCKVMLLDEGDDLVGRGKARAPCRRIIIEYAVDDRGALGRGIVDDIGHRVGPIVDESLDRRRFRPGRNHLGAGGGSGGMGHLSLHNIIFTKINQ